VARGQNRGIGRGAGVPGGIAPNRQTKFVTQKLLVPDNSGPLGSFVNTLSSSPQIANYNLIAGIGFFLASLVSGQVPGANAQEYRHGTHAASIQTAEGLKSTIFQAQVAPPAAVTAVPPFISVQQQTYDDVKPALFEPVIIGQGAVPATTLAPPQSDPTQIGAQIFEPLAPTAIVPNPIAAFFATLPQDENRQYSTIWESQTAGQKPPVISFTRSVSQDDTSQIAAQVIKASQSAPAVSAQWVPPPVIGLQQIYSDILPAAIFPPASTPPTVASAVPPFTQASPQNENRQYSVVWKSQTAGQTPPVIPFVKGSPQADPAQIAAQVFKAPPAAITPIAAFFATLPQNENRQYSVVWKSQVAVAPPAAITPIAAFFATLPQNENRQYSFVWKSQVAGAAAAHDQYPLAGIDVTHSLAGVDRTYSLAGVGRTYPLA